MKPFRTVVVLLLLLLAGVLAAQWMAGTDRDLGEVFVRFAGYDLHTNVPRALLALALAAALAAIAAVIPAYSASKLDVIDALRRLG